MINIEKLKFWTGREDWAPDEKRLRREAINFGIIYLIIIILFAIMFATPFHAAEIPDGYHTETVWDDEKGEWTTVIVPNKTWTGGKYEIDVDGAEYIFKRVFNIIYTSLLPLASILAATFTAYDFTILMTTKNQQKINEAYTHIKVIWKVWLYIMLTSVIITLAVQGFTEIVNSPYANPIIHP